MKLIAAADENWGIGKNGGLLAHIPEDMKFFREMTTGHPLVMGRKTLESFPGARPLKNRVNIVLTRDDAYKCDGAVIVHCKEELDALLAAYDTEDVFVIGGSSIYALLLDECDTAYITKIAEKYEADAFFPDLDSKPEWNAVHESEIMEFNGLQYRFVTYKKIRPQAAARTGTVRA